MSANAQPASNNHQPTFIDVTLSDIDASKTNPRRFFDETQLNELADSIKQQGVLEPVLLRVKPEAAGRYELIVGERRWRSAKLAELSSIPAIIREMSDDQVLDAQIHENLHRADVHPMDEAFGYQHLLKVVPNLNVEELARRVGKSPKYVAQRLSLTTLIEPAVKEFMDGLVTLGHAGLIAQLAPEVQPQALDACYPTKWHWDKKTQTNTNVPDRTKSAKTVADLAAWINQNLVLDLKKAPWSLEDAELVPKQGACSTCPANTSTNQLLFGDAAQSALCTNPEGYERKMQAWQQKQIAKITLEDRPPYLITEIYRIDKNDVRRWNLTPEALGKDAYYLIEKKKDRCEHARGAVFVQGSRRGQTASVCTEPKCKDHKGRVSSPSSNTSSGAEKSPAEKKQFYARKQELFDARVAEPVRRRTLNAILEKIHPAATDIDDESKVVWPISRDYFARMAVEHFLRIASDTQLVMYEVMGLPDIVNIKGDTWSAPKKRQEMALAHVSKFDDTKLLRFMVLCSIAHYAENFNLANKRDMTQIVKLAAEHDVPYKLFDARERLKQNPAKRFNELHKRHLLQVLLGQDVNPPLLYAENFHIDGAAIYAEIDKLEEEVKARITLTPYKDGYNGIASAEGAQDEAKPDAEIADELLDVIRRCKSIHELRDLRRTFEKEHELRSRPIEAEQLHRINVGFNGKSLLLPGSLESDVKPLKAETPKKQVAASKKVVAKKSAKTKQAAKKAAKKIPAKKK